MYKTKKFNEQNIYILKLKMYENGKPPVRFKDYSFNIQVCEFYLFFCYGCDYFLKLWDIVELIL